MDVILTKTNAKATTTIKDLWVRAQASASSRSKHTTTTARFTSTEFDLKSASTLWPNKFKSSSATQRRGPSANHKSRSWTLELTACLSVAATLDTH